MHFETEKIEYTEYYPGAPGRSLTERVRLLTKAIAELETKVDELELLEDEVNLSIAAIRAELNRR